MTPSSHFPEEADSGIALTARRLTVVGRVQGVGFRPFVFRLAHRLGLHGSVRNEAGTVDIFVQGPPSALLEFERALLQEAPPLARPAIASGMAAEPGPLESFAILPSREASTAHVHVPPDYFACDDCLRELHDPTDRRYRYPFINCTQCGPRYTLIRKLPYDRPNTTMSQFTLCPACRREYENPLDRRFHAEPVACPACGPALHFAAPGGADIHDGTALTQAVAALRAGKIVAVKGIGGYHLMCDARNDIAVARLRAKKPRPHKPLAVMFPARGADGLDAVRTVAELTPEHERWLRDPARPIVLVNKKPRALSPRIAPGLKEIGVMLPYSPLHDLLLLDFGGPLVATSANVSGEPVLTDNDEVDQRLRHVAEAFLHHNRPIQRPADDPVMRVIGGHARPLRHGRGSAPLELPLPFTLAKPVLAVGAHMKNTVALAWNDRVVVSPHIGDLDAPRSLAVFEQVIADLQALYDVRVRAGRDAPVCRCCRYCIITRTPRRSPASIRTRGTGWCSPGTASVTAPTGRSGAARRCWARPDAGGASAAGGLFTCLAGRRPGANPGARRCRCAGKRASNGSSAPKIRSWCITPGNAVSTVRKPRPPEDCSTRPPR